MSATVKVFLKTLKNTHTGTCIHRLTQCVIVKQGKRKWLTFLTSSFGIHTALNTQRIPTALHAQAEVCPPVLVTKMKN